jgi:amidase
VSTQLDITAAQQLEAYVQGEVSPVEAVEATLRHAVAIQSHIAPFVEIFEEHALEEAQASDLRYRAGDARLLDGLPIVVKDSVAISGSPTGFGSAATGTTAAAHDAGVVSRLRAAGAIFIGRTTCPEFTSLPVTESARMEPTRNPFDLGKTAGGSSGGSAAVVGAGVTAVAHGNDGAGSLRIPAACCGLFAIKPTRGRISHGPMGAESPRGMIQEGFLTRAVADQALLLDATMGLSAGDPYLAPPFEDTLQSLAERDPGTLRIGVTTTAPIEADVDPACAAAVGAATEMLSDLGHEVDELDMSWQRAGNADLFGLMWAAVTAFNIDETLGSDVDLDLIEPHNAALYVAAKETPVRDYHRALAALERFGRDVMSRFDEVDVVLTPTLATPPLDVGALFAGAGDDPMEPIARALAFIPFTPVSNLTGQPAASLPIHLSPDGLPIGVQLMAGVGREDHLLQLARQLEPWFKRPELAAELAAAGP